MEYLEINKKTGNIKQVMEKTITSVNIPEKIDGTKVNGLGKYAFDGCSSLTAVKLPDGLTTIGQYAFYRCSALPSVKLPNSLTTIEHGAFVQCSSLTAMTIPSSVTSVGFSSFWRCNNLVVTIEQTDPRKIKLDVNSFDSVKEIRVPQESLEAYKKAAQWVRYADMDMIKPIEKKQEQVQERRRGRRM